MLVDQKPGLTYFDGYGKMITSLSKIPENIRDSAAIVLNKFLGDLSPKAKFYYGQILDFDAYHKFKDSANINPTIPKYELVFILKDLSIGIKSYPIELRLNEFGKALKLNWPRKGYTNKSKFQLLDTIRNNVLNRAKKLNFNLSNYEIAFDYDYEAQKFYWTFLFPVQKEQNFSQYNTIRTNWVNLDDFDVSETRRVTVY